MTFKNEKTLTNRLLLCDLGYEESIVFRNPDYDSAIIGVTHDGRVVYEYNKMVEDLMNEDDMTEIDAVDFIDYNTIRSLPYAGDEGPIIMYMLDNV